jgi:5-methylcytosine-specific restriction endonuclease McrA
MLESRADRKIRKKIERIIANRRANIGKRIKNASIQCKTEGEKTPSENEKDAFYNSKIWHELRFKTLRKYGFKCMACKDEESPLQVDHIRPTSIFWAMRFDEDNLQVLCKACNIGKTNAYMDDLRPKPGKVILKKAKIVIHEKGIHDIHADKIYRRAHEKEMGWEYST